MFGTQLFFLYIYDSFTNAKVLRCVDNYKRLGVIETMQWSPPKDVERFLTMKGQYFTQTECIYRLMYRAKYLVEVDIDELIVPMQADNWTAMINSIDKRVLNGSGDELIASYNFRCRHIPLNWKDNFDRLHNDTKRILDGLASGHRFWTLSHTTSEDRLFPWLYRSKVIARTDRVLMWDVHQIQPHHVVPSWLKNYFVEESDGVLHHYRRPPDDISWTKPQDAPRMIHFADEIIKRLKIGMQVYSQKPT
jgi:hypothetical protein